MDSLQDLILPTVAAFTLPGLVAWALARRHGLGVFWASLIAGAVVMVYGWLVSRPDIAADAAGQRVLLIYFVLLPGFMSLVLGAIVGAWQHRMRMAL